MKPLLVSGLSFSFGRDPVLQDVNLALEPGRMYALLGRNGSGKSTLLRVLTGVLPKKKGQILWNGTPLHKLTPGQLARHVAVVWTGRPMEALRVHEVLNTGAPAGMHPDEIGKRISELTREWHLGHLIQRPVGELSDGEAQSVLIARALIQDTPVVLLDEPATHLDLVRKANIFALLRQLTRQGKTVLFSTHDIQLLSGLADRILVLDQGVLQEYSPAEAFDALASLFRNEMLIFDRNCQTFKLRNL